MCKNKQGGQLIKTENRVFGYHLINRVSELS